MIDTNCNWLRQALTLLSEVDDAAYAGKTSGHIRHIIEFYECFLDGADRASIDYDARRRDLSLERSRNAAVSRIREVMHRLVTTYSLRHNFAVEVRQDGFTATSSVARELMELSSHTIHHFALIALTLRMAGFEVDADFGVAPSTLEYQRKAA